MQLFSAVLPLMLTTMPLTFTALTAGETPVREPLCIEEPVDRAIYQRNDAGTAEVPVACQISGSNAERVIVRAMDRRTKEPIGDWVRMTSGATVGRFHTHLMLSAGWYQLEFRAIHGDTVVTTGALDHLGVGEVFVTCGQSNAANHGKPRQRAVDERVSSCDYLTGRWVPAADPQPGASGKGGSPWPLLGDQLVQRLNVPVGFICIGVGSTPVSFWTPTGKGYPRLKTALQRAGLRGVRAVLWHQGESDSIIGTTAEEYARMLGDAIAQSRKDAGWPVPWGIALASFHPAKEATPNRQAMIVAGQKKVIAETGNVFPGPETDRFHTQGWLCDGVHFNAEGLAAHAQGWAQALLPLILQPAAKGP